MLLLFYSTLRYCSVYPTAVAAVSSGSMPGPELNGDGRKEKLVGVVIYYVDLTGFLGVGTMCVNEVLYS